MPPILRRFNNLGLVEFQTHPVWVSVSSFDRGQPWYEEADEETFRPWLDQLPIAKSGIALVLASLELRNGSVYPGFMTPAQEDWDAPLRVKGAGGLEKVLRSPSSRHAGSPLAILGIQQPRIFVGQQSFGFWGGMLGVSDERRAAFYQAVGVPPEEVFPIKFHAENELATGITSGQLDGFYRSVVGGTPLCTI